MSFVSLNGIPKTGERYLESDIAVPSQPLLSFPQKSKKKNLQINIKGVEGKEEKAETVMNPDHTFTPTQNRVIESIYKKYNNFFREEAAPKSLPQPLTPKRYLRLSPTKLPEIQPPSELIVDEKGSSYTPKKVKHLRTLYSFLLNVFMQIMPSQISIMLLSSTDLLLLQYILERKFHVAVNFKQTAQGTVDEILNTLNDVYTLNSTKRKEENIKLVFKWIVKKMKKFYREEYKGPMNDFHDFYEHYFGETCRKSGVPIETFYDPTNIDRSEAAKGRMKYKSINTNYLKHVFQCQKFREAFVEILKGSNIEEDYGRKLEKKMEKLLSRWDRLYAKVPLQQLEAKVEAYFKKSLRCKLPWTYKEAVNAIGCFFKFIEALDLK